MPGGLANPKIVPQKRTPSQRERADQRRPTVKQIIAQSVDFDKYTSGNSWEIVGWLMYDAANGAFFYGASAYFPALVTGQAKEVAKEMFCGLCLNNTWAIDFENDGKCSNEEMNTFTTCDGNGDDWSADFKKEASNVPFFGIDVGYASVFSFCTTISVVLQLLAFLTMGSFADYGPNRKNMMFVFNKLGVLCLFLVIMFKEDADYMLNGAMYIISTVCFSFCVVFYNAYIPLLVKALPSFKRVVDEEMNNPDRVASKKRVKEKYDSLTSTLSIKGMMCGFGGQFVFLIAMFAITLYTPDTNNFNIRFAIAVAGIWVFFMSLITFSLLHRRPGPPLPEGETYATHSLKQAYTTFSNFKYLPELGKFSFAYFIFSDGASTLAGASIVFAQEEMNFSFLQIGITLLLVSACAVFGCWFFWKISQVFNISDKNILALNLFFMAILPIWASIGLTTTLEFYMVAALFGLNTGSYQAFTRTIYATMIPYGREAEYFSFYEVSDKGTAWLGPLVLAIVNDATGSFRTAFVYLEIFFVVGLLLLYIVDIEKALEEKVSFDLQHNDYFFSRAERAVENEELAEKQTASFHIFNKGHSSKSVVEHDDDNESD